MATRSIPSRFAPGTDEKVIWLAALNTRFSLPELPPSATAKASFRFLTLDLLIVASVEKRCEPKS